MTPSTHVHAYLCHPLLKKLTAPGWFNPFQSGCHFERVSISCTHPQLSAFCSKFHCYRRPLNCIHYFASFCLFVCLFLRAICSFCCKTNVAWTVCQTAYDWKGLRLGVCLRIKWFITSWHGTCRKPLKQASGRKPNYSAFAFNERVEILKSVAETVMFLCFT